MPESANASASANSSANETTTTHVDFPEILPFVTSLLDEPEVLVYCSYELDLRSY
jgi:hypothetical protein